MLIVYLAFQQPSAGWFVLRKLKAVVFKDGDFDLVSGQRLLRRAQDGLTPAVLAELVPDRLSFLTDMSSQLRGVFTDVAASDADELNRWFEAIYPTEEVLSHAPGYTRNPGRFTALIAYILGDLLPGELNPIYRTMMLASTGATPVPTPAMRVLTALAIDVPRAETRNGEPTVTYRRMTVMSVGSTCLVFWLRGRNGTPEPSAGVDTATDDVLNPDEFVTLEDPDAYPDLGYAPDGLSPGALANQYVNRALYQYETCLHHLQGALERWEVDFYAQAAKDDVTDSRLHTAIWDVRRLSAIRTQTAGLRNRLEAFRRQEVTRFSQWSDHDETALGSWTQPIENLTGLADRARSDLQEALALVTSGTSARLLEISRLEEGRRERLQRAVTLITAFLLIPGLIAGVYAAGGSVPGGASESARAIWMGALMLTGALTTLALVGLYNSGRRTAAAVLAVGALVAVVAVFAVTAGPRESRSSFGSRPDRCAPPAVC